MKAALHFLALILLVMTVKFESNAQSAQKPIRLAVAGMTHGHISFILGRKDKGDFELAGFYEPNRELAIKLSKQYHFDTLLIYSNLGEMLDKVKPEAAVAFGSVYEHLAVVEACAPRGIHVMVEKPLAVSNVHARRMAELVQKHGIHLLTDFETSWYLTTHQSFALVNDSNFIGKIKKTVIHDGHQGPKEIGCDQYFLDWLTDPVQNGGGALIDFGCYGANLMTYLMKGEEPTSVTAVTRQLKPEIYPKVDDEATIIVSYPSAQCIIQASWNWPFGRKDMEIYGDSGLIIASDSKTLHLRNASMKEEQVKRLTDKDIQVEQDPFTYFSNVIRNKTRMTPYDPYSLTNNLTVVKILDAARESAKTGKTIILNAKAERR